MRLELPRLRRIRLALEEPFPATWRSILERRWSLWPTFSAADQARLEDLVKVFVADKRWEAANRFTVTDEIRVLIAAQACLLILELDHDYYRHSGSIIVHPSTVVLTGPRPAGAGGIVVDGPFPILGQAQHRGPIVIAWDAARFDARHPERGHNVVFHEFAHKLDMLDGTVDGTPPLRDDATRNEWIAVCSREYRALRAGFGGPVLDDYGAVNPGEFFAVATEVFFSRPVDLREDKSELYGVLAGFYQQDPAARQPAA